MASIYVRTTGNDTTGTGATGLPYATLKKALSVAIGGDIILLGTGTYAEDSGSGYLSVQFNYVSFVQVWPESGVLGDVIVTGTSAAYAVYLSTSSFAAFHNIVFRSQNADVTSVMRLIGTTITDVRFVRCRFEVVGKTGVTNTAVISAWTSGTWAINRLAFIKCEVREIGPFSVAGFLLDNSGPSGTVIDLQVIGCEIVTGNFAVRLKGLLSRLVVHDNTVMSYSSAFAATALQIGEDAATGLDITGTVTNNRITAMTGHAAVIGAGCSAVDVLGNTFYGGANSSNGQGLVIKNATGGRVAKNTVYGGYLSTLYLKACTGMLIEDNDVYVRFATGPGIRAGINSENNSKIGNNIVRGNRVMAALGTVFAWDGDTGDAGGNVVDQNAYVVSGSATFGSVRGQTLTTIASLRTAWADYSQPYNDSTSRLGAKSVRHQGDRQVALT